MSSELSFRDPAGTLVEQTGLLYRFIQPKFKKSILEFIQSEFYKKNTENLKIVPSAIIDKPKEFLEVYKDHLCLQHKKIEFVSYPWEWSFEQLKTAALLTLDLQIDALQNNLTLKDATSLNIVFDGNKAIFVDVLSFEPYIEGKPWIAYGQFCRYFLFPLMINAYRGIDFSKFIFTQLGELSVNETMKILGYKNILKKGVFFHVFLQNLLQNNLSNSATQTKKTPNIPKQFILNNIHSLKKIVSNLKYPYNKNNLLWENYAQENSYNNTEQNEKVNYIELVLSSNLNSSSILIDFGANSGFYSRIASKHAKKVLSVELDSSALNSAFVKSKENICHFLCDVTKPTPSMGFNLKERKSFPQRVKGDFFLALAIIHHLRISAGIPMEKILECLFQYAPMGIIEWVDPTDSMVKQMLLNRENVFYDYSWENFQKLVEKNYNFIEIQNLSKQTRKLCLIERKI